MKLKVITLSLATATFALVQNGQAQTDTNLFPLSFRAVCTSTNSAGDLFQDVVVNANLIDDCAVEHPNSMDKLRLVFNRTNFSIQVVDTNGVALCTSFAFSGGLTLANSNNTAIVFQHNVFVGTNATASGVVSGSATWNSADLTSFKLSAALLYIEPASGTNAPEICTAVLRVGKRENNEEEENEGNEHGHGHGNEGNNGNHFGWQNPHNPHSHR